MNLNNLKIGKRLMLGFGAVITLAIVLIVSNWIGFSKVQTRYWKTNMFTTIESDLLTARLNSRLYIQYEETQYADKLLDAINILQSNIDKLAPTLSQKVNQDQLTRIKVEAKDYKEAANQYIEVTKIKQEELKKFDELAKSIMEVLSNSRATQNSVVNFMNARIYGQKYLRLNKEEDFKNWENIVNYSQSSFTGELGMILAEYKGAFNKVHEQVKIQKDNELKFKSAGESLNKEVESGVSSMTDQMVSEINRAITIMITLGIIAIILGIIFATIINNSIRIGINKGVAIASNIADGDVTITIENSYLERKDEIGDLSRTLQKMTDKLKEVVESMVVGANNIASASEQTSSTAQQLSQGANEQASSVEEVSSTMEEMASNIQQNTDNAQQTDKIATFSATGIKNVATAAQNSLNSIKNISDKISIINDIAFQTNILALNAAVEAARAGEHGRGFAVVAAEVRKLAERSKLAANEIVELAKSSVQTTEEAGRLMMTILPEIEKTAKLVQEIAAASVEQNNGSIQINNAIQQLNAITQQNASASEELASNAEELTSQAEQLRSIVSYFKVDIGQNIKSSFVHKKVNAPVHHETPSAKVTSKKGVNIKMNLHSADDENYTHF